MSDKFRRDLVEKRELLEDQYRLLGKGLLRDLGNEQAKTLGIQTTADLTTTYTSIRSTFSRVASGSIPIPSRRRMDPIQSIS